MSVRKGSARTVLSCGLAIVVPCLLSEHVVVVRGKRFLCQFWPKVMKALWNSELECFVFSTDGKPSKKWQIVAVMEVWFLIRSV